MDIRPVTWTNLWHFLALPRTVYARNRGRWVPPLTPYTWLSMGRLREPGKIFYVAYRQGRPVARIGFKVHRHGGYEALHFGYFEALPGTEAEVSAMIELGHQLAPNLPIRGPHQFRLEDPYTGLLVDGFDEEPYFLMSYNPPYYAELLAAAGLHKAMDLLTYRYSPDRVRLDIMAGRADRARAKGIEVRPLSGPLRPQVELMAEVFNAALANNWGFERIEGEQLEELYMLARFILKPEYVYFAFLGGRAVGCVIILPNLNPMFAASQGRLGPTLIWKYLTRDRWVDTFRGYALGVHPEARADQVSAALIHAVMSQGHRIRWRELEMSWVLENNRPMRAMAEALGGHRNKVYRVLEKSPS